MDFQLSCLFGKGQVVPEWWVGDQGSEVPQMKTRVVLFGQELTFPIIKANHEPEMLKLLYFMKLTSTFLQSDILMRSPRNWKWFLHFIFPDLTNDFLEALDHHPLGKKTPCCAMSQAVPADLNWNQARCGKRKLGRPVWAVNFVTAKRQAPSCCHFWSQFQGLVIFWRGSFLECPFKFKMVKKNSETNSKNLRSSIFSEDEISF